MSYRTKLRASDVQSVALLGNSFELVRKIKLGQSKKGDLVAFPPSGLIPALPTLAKVMPVTKILKGLLHLIAMNV